MITLPATLWEHALCRLHKLGWSDYRIAAALTDMSDADIRALDVAGWYEVAAREAVEDAYGSGGGGKEWAWWEVNRDRHRFGLATNRHEGDRETARARIIHAERPEIISLGWGALLSDHPDLRLIEARILSALHSHGPLTRSQLQSALSHRLRRRDGRWWTTCLRSRELITALGIYEPRGTYTRRTRHTLMLSPGVAPVSQTRRANRVDRLGMSAFR
jgi:hypothetical protein